MRDSNGGATKAKQAQHHYKGGREALLEHHRWVALPHAHLAGHSVHGQVC